MASNPLLTVSTEDENTPEAKVQMRQKAKRKFGEDFQHEQFNTVLPDEPDTKQSKRGSFIANLGRSRSSARLSIGGRSSSRQSVGGRSSRLSLSRRLSTSSMRERASSLVSPMKRGVKALTRSMKERKRADTCSQASAREFYGKPLRESDKTWCSTQIPETLKALSKREINRQEAVYELVSGEKKYLHMLNMICGVHRKTLLGLKIVTEEESHEIFGNLDDIKAASTDLDALLDANVDETGAANVGQAICDWFPRHADAFSQYCMHQAASKMCIAKLKSNKKFQHFIEMATDLRQAAMKDMSGLLDSPRVRLQNYRLMVQRIKSYTPESHSDYAYLEQAIVACHKYVSEADNQVQLAELQRTLEFSRVHRMDLLTSGQKLITSVDATLIDSKEVKLILFESALVVAKPKRRREGWIVHGRPMKLQYLAIQDIAEDETDCVVKFRNKELVRSNSTHSMRGSLRNTRVRKASQHGKSSVTVKFAGFQQKLDFLALLDKTVQSHVLKYPADPELEVTEAAESACTSPTLSLGRTSKSGSGTSLSSIQSLMRRSSSRGSRKHKKQAHRDSQV
eukprot:m.57217 g.57217  ORF g.57217 m.57217 type:complete len:568 (-) comp11593_c0_seq2:375-2078(-)